MSVAIIIPAYNEEKTIKDVINAAKQVKKISKIIVVSDGSTDNTVQVALETGVEVIALPKNVGKGGALSTGVKNCSDDVLVFLDADLIGLKKKHIESLIKPVIKNKAIMSIGVFVNGKAAVDLSQKMFPHLSGQRAMKRELFEAINSAEVSKFGIEVLLTKYVKENNIKYVKVEFENVTHVMKEKKRGFIKGTKARLVMYYDILKNVVALKK